MLWVQQAIYPELQGSKECWVNESKDIFVCSPSAHYVEGTQNTAGSGLGSLESPKIFCKHAEIVCEYLEQDLLISWFGVFTFPTDIFSVI